jgi:hypothetical protein
METNTKVILLFQSPNNDVDYILDAATNSVNISEFFNVGRRASANGDLGILSLKRSMREYPNSNAEFSVTVSCCFLLGN